MSYESFKIEAIKAFEKILDEQIERNEKIKNSPKKKDFTSMKKIRIGFIGGDGIGPYITECAERIVKHLLKDDIESEKVETVDIKGLTIEQRLECGKPVPDKVLAEIKKCDVFVKGPTTTPSGGNMESANVALRRELDLFANVRPVAIPEQNIDWTFFRENTEGEYVLGSRGIEKEECLAMDFKVTTVEGTKRIARAAFDFARANNKKSVTIVTKSNIMKKTDGLFSKICHEIAYEYPEIVVDEYYIDIMCANLLNEKRRSMFEVILLPNLYGDIITDEAAQIQGGVGTAGSANIGNSYAMFEAIHGSAPRMVEEGRAPYADPESIIKASAMMLSHIGMNDKAEKIEKALSLCRDLPAFGKKTAREYTDELIKTIDSL